MPAEEPQLNSGSQPSTSPSAGAIGPIPGRTAAYGAGPRLPLWLLTLGAGLGAGLISWAGGEATFKWFPIAGAIVYPANYKQISGYEKMAITTKITGEARVVVERRKAAVAFGSLGFLLGLSLGLTGGLAVGSARAARTAAVFGGVGGAAVGSGLSFAILPWFFRYLNPEQGLIVLFLTHAVIFAGVGAVAGAALGLGLNERSTLGRALSGGVLGALVGTFAFEAINSLGFPLVRTFELVPTEWLMRLTTHLSVAVWTAFIAGLAAGTPTRKSVASPR